MKLLTTKKGFTLVEVMVALALFSVLFLSAMTLLTQVLKSQQEDTAISQVNLEGNYALTQITETMRNASAITTPAAAATSTSLSVTPIGSSLATIVSLSGTTLTLKVGNAAAVALTSPNVKVTNLVFTNLTPSKGKGTVRITMTVASVKTYNSTSAVYSQTYYTTVTLR